MKKKVLELCEAYGGGVRTQVDYLNQYMSKSYSLITLVSSKREGFAPDDYIVDDRLSSIKNPIKFWGAVNHVHKLIQKNNIDVVHAHSTISGIVMVLYRVIFRSKVSIIFTPHAYYSEVDRGKAKNYILEFIERYMNKNFDKIIHVSDEEQRYALKHRLVDKDKCLVIDNGVAFKNEKKISHKDIIIVNVARCGYQKNPQLFIKLAKNVLSSLPGCRFVWVGDGPLLQECIEIVKENGLQEKIKFVGYSNTPEKYLKSSDIYMSTSRYEGLPFSVLEALSYKMPLVLTDVIGHNDLVDGNGVLLNSELKDMDMLVKDFRDVINNMSKYAIKSFKIYQEKYTVEKMITKIAQVYDYLS